MPKDEHLYDEKLRGRNGPDGLFFFLCGVFLLLFLLGVLLRNAVLLLCDFPIAAWLIFRLLSRNLPARKRENRIFFAVISCRHLRRALRARQRKKRGEFFSTCPACGARLKIRRRKGDFLVTCPRCQTRFRLHIR